MKACRWIALVTLAVILLPVCSMAESGGFLESYKELLKKVGKLGLLTTEDFLWEYEEENLLSAVEWEELRLDGNTAAAYPELAASLEEINRQRRESSEELSEELSALAEDAFGDEEGSGHCSGRFDYYVQRADHAVLSFRSDSEIYWGGAHPDYGTAGINLNPDTGEEIRLSDVITDMNALTALLAQRLQEKYPDIVYDSDLGDKLTSFKEDEFEWTLGHEGITFYFNPYIILPYAAGKTTATIRFDEAEELFNPEYLPVFETAYAVKIPLFEEIESEMNPADSSMDVISVSAVMGEYEAYEQLWIKVNGETYTEEIYAYNINAYLAVTGDGADRKCFLYMEMIGDSGYPVLAVYDLNSGAPCKVGELSGSEFTGGIYTGKAVFTDPGAFTLDTRMDILGTHFGFREYGMDESSGMPLPKQDDYGLNNYGNFITSLIELEVFNLNTQEVQVIPVGTDFYVMRTDGETYMDFRLDDGSECRVEVDTSGYPDCINGIPEDECFEGIMYAG